MQCRVAQKKQEQRQGNISYFTISNPTFCYIEVMMKSEQ